MVIDGEGPNRSRRPSSVPHLIGEGAGGGGANLAWTAGSSDQKSWGAQFASAMRPWPTHPQELGGDRVLVRGEGNTEARQHHVEAVVIEVEGFGISLPRWAAHASVRASRDLRTPRTTTESVRNVARSRARPLGLSDLALNAGRCRRPGLGHPLVDGASASLGTRSAGR